MFVRRAFGFLRRSGLCSRFAAGRRLSTAGFPEQLDSDCSSWGKHHWILTLGFVLSGQTAVFLALKENTALAEDASVADTQEEVYLNGLQRIEDGSVISNLHTSKWRVFTDNGRELFMRGKLDEAEKYFLAALHEAKEGFGAKDPHVAAALNNLAELYRVRKEFEKAEPLYLEAISILEESFGKDDIRVGAALHNLGQFYLVQKKLEQARGCYERALKIKGRVLGYGHLDYADTMYHLGVVLHLQGKDKDAEALIVESIRILEEAGLGETMTCIRRMKYLSQMLLKGNRLAEAEKLQRKTLHLLEITKGWDSLDTVVAAESLALTLQPLGNLTEARELLERCLKVRRKVLGEQNIQVAANMLHLARIAILKSKHLHKVKPSEARAELDKAKVLLDTSIRITKKILANLQNDRKNFTSTSTSKEIEKDEQAVLISYVQLLDAVGLWELTRYESEEVWEACPFPIEAESALREGIAIFKEPRFQSLLLASPEIKAEYLSCLRHLLNTVTECTANGPKKSRALQELKDEVQQIEAELSPKKQRN